eukprot:1399113-Rhodomonas_salina.1
MRDGEAALHGSQLICPSHGRCCWRWGPDCPCSQVSQPCPCMCVQWDAMSVNLQTEASAFVIGVCCYVLLCFCMKRDWLRGGNGVHRAPDRQVEVLLPSSLPPLPATLLPPPPSSSLLLLSTHACFWSFVVVFSLSMGRSFELTCACFSRSFLSVDVLVSHPPSCPAFVTLLRVSAVEEEEGTPWTERPCQVLTPHTNARYCHTRLLCGVRPESAFAHRLHRRPALLQ